jgi:shikimate kinase
VRRYVTNEERHVQSDIVLIGPIRSSKSTVGALLAEELGVPPVSLEEVCQEYFREVGFL